MAYLISPMDVIPEIILPYIGWLDDGVVLATVIYMIRTGRLPDFRNFIFKKKRRNNSPKGREKTHAGNSGTKNFSKRETREKNSKENKGGTQKQEPSAWEVLGIEPGSSKEKIQQAYKEAIKKYHPDKLSHLGEEFSNLANEKFLAVQKAYNILMKKN